MFAKNRIIDTPFKMSYSKDSMDNLCELCQDGFSSSQEFDDHFVKYHLNLQKSLTISSCTEVVYNHKGSDFINNESYKESPSPISNITSQFLFKQCLKTETKETPKCFEQSYYNQIAAEGIKSEISDEYYSQSNIFFEYKNPVEKVLIKNEHLDNEPNDLVSSCDGFETHFLDSDHKTSISNQNNVLNANTIICLPIKKEDIVLTIKTEAFLNNENSFYYCNFERCRRYFHLDNHLKYHIKCHASDGSQYLCPECSLTFPVWSLIKHHLFLLHSIDLDVLKCSFCKYTFTWKSKLINHIRDYHYSIPKYYLSNIGKNMNRKEKFSLEYFNTALKNTKNETKMMKYVSLKDNIKLHNLKLNSKHLCQDKNLNLSNYQNLLSRNSKVMRRPKQINKINIVKSPPKCEFLKKWLNHNVIKLGYCQKKNVTGFSETNEKEKFHCSFCDFSTKYKETINCHQKFCHHKPTSIPSSETDVNQADITDLSKVQICPFKYCRQSFLFEEHLKDHINCHSNQSRNLKCFVCEIIFNQNEWGKLRSHLNKVHAINLDTAVCNICSKVYPSKSIEEHYEIHKNSKATCKNKPTVKKLICPKINTAIFSLNSNVPTTSLNYIVTEIQDRVLIPEKHVFNLLDSNKNGLQETSKNINSTDYETLTLTPVSGQNAVLYSCCDVQDINQVVFFNHLKTRHLYEYLLRQTHLMKGGTLYYCPICCFTSKNVCLYCPYHNFEVCVKKSVQMTLKKNSNQKVLGPIMVLSISNLEPVKALFFEKDKKKPVKPLYVEKKKKKLLPRLELKIDYLCKFKDCIYKFAFEDHLNFHLKCHTGIPDECSYYKCPFCLKIYSHDQWYVLTNHLSLHQVVLEEFKCDICTHACRTESDLKAHKKIHLICEYCWESLISKQELIKHVLTHVNKLWMCKQCELVYTCESHMLKHRRSVHKYISEVIGNYFVALNNNSLPNYQNLSKQVQSFEKLEEKCQCEYCLCDSIGRHRTRYDRQKYKCCSYTWNDFHAFNIHLRGYHSQEYFIRFSFKKKNNFCYCPECYYTITDKTHTFCPCHNERVKLVSHTSPLVL